MEDMEYYTKRLPRVHGLLGGLALDLGALLLKKPNKTELEFEAAKAYKTVLRWSCVTIILIFIIIACAIVHAFVSPFEPYSAKRTGTVEGDRVRYVQNDLKYSTLEKLGIDKKLVKQGDELTLYFDRQDNLKGAELETSINSRLYILLGTIVGGITLLIAFIIIMRHTIGRSWYDWYNNMYENLKIYGY